MTHLLENRRNLSFCFVKCSFFGPKPYQRIFQTLPLISGTKTIWFLNLSYEQKSCFSSLYIYIGDDTTQLCGYMISYNKDPGSLYSYINQAVYRNEIELFFVRGMVIICLVDLVFFSPSRTVDGSEIQPISLWVVYLTTLPETNIAP